MRAGLCMPVSRVHSMLHSSRLTKRISSGAPVFMAAVLEYMVAEVWELAGAAARQHKKARILPSHIMLAVQSDEELSAMMRNVTVASGGVQPHVHRALLPKKKQ